MMGDRDPDTDSGGPARQCGGGENRHADEHTGRGDVGNLASLVSPCKRLKLSTELEDGLVEGSHNKSQHVSADSEAELVSDEVVSVKSVSRNVGAETDSKEVVSENSVLRKIDVSEACGRGKVSAMVRLLEGEVGGQMDEPSKIDDDNDDDEVAMAAKLNQESLATGTFTDGGENICEMSPENGTEHLTSEQSIENVNEKTVENGTEHLASGHSIEDHENVNEGLTNMTRTQSDEMHDEMDYQIENLNESLTSITSGETDELNCSLQTVIDLSGCCIEPENGNAPEATELGLTSGSEPEVADVTICEGADMIKTAKDGTNESDKDNNESYGSKEEIHCHNAEGTGLIDRTNECDKDNREMYVGKEGLGCHNYAKGKTSTNNANILEAHDTVNALSMCNSVSGIHAIDNTNKLKQPNGELTFIPGSNCKLTEILVPETNLDRFACLGKETGQFAVSGNRDIGQFCETTNVDRARQFEAVPVVTRSVRTYLRDCENMARDNQDLNAVPGQDFVNAIGPEVQDLSTLVPNEGLSDYPSDQCAIDFDVNPCQNHGADGVTDVVDNTVNLVDNTVNLVDNTVNLVDNEVNMVENAVNMVDSTVNMVDNTVNVVDNSMIIVDNEVNMVDNAVVLVDSTGTATANLVDNTVNAEYDNRLDNGCVREIEGQECVTPDRKPSGASHEDREISGFNSQPPRVVLSIASQQYKDRLNVFGTQQPRDISNIVGSCLPRDISNIVGSQQPRDVSNIVGSCQPRDISNIVGTQQPTDISSIASHQLENISRIVNQDSEVVEEASMRSSVYKSTGPLCASTPVTIKLQPRLRQGDSVQTENRSNNDYTVLKTFKPVENESNANYFEHKTLKPVGSAIIKVGSSIPLCTSTPVVSRLPQSEPVARRQQGLKVRDMNIPSDDGDDRRGGKKGDKQVVSAFTQRIEQSGKVSSKIELFRDVVDYSENVDHIENEMVQVMNEFNTRENYKISNAAENNQGVAVKENYQIPNGVSSAQDPANNEVKGDTLKRRSKERGSKRDKRSKGPKKEKFKEYLGPGLTSEISSEMSSEVNTSKKDFLRNTDIETCTLTEYKGFGLTGPLPEKHATSGALGATLKPGALGVPLKCSTIVEDPEETGMDDNVDNRNPEQSYPNVGLSVVAAAKGLVANPKGMTKLFPKADMGTASVRQAGTECFLLENIDTNMIRNRFSMPMQNRPTNVDASHARQIGMEGVDGFQSGAIDTNMIRNRFSAAMQSRQTSVETIQTNPPAIQVRHAGMDTRPAGLEGFNLNSYPGILVAGSKATERKGLVASASTSNVNINRSSSFGKKVVFNKYFSGPALNSVPNMQSLPQHGILRSTQSQGTLIGGPAFRDLPIGVQYAGCVPQAGLVMVRDQPIGMQYGGCVPHAGLALQPDQAYPSVVKARGDHSDNSAGDKSDKMYAADKSDKIFDPSVLQSDGQVKISAYMNFGLLTVHVVQARQLQTKWKTASDSFVKLSLIPDDGKKAKCKTEVVQDSNNPLYDEKFSFELTEEDHSKRLMISLWHRDQSASLNEFLGCMSFGLRHLTNPKKEVNGWYYLLTEDIGRKKHLQVSHRQRPALKVRNNSNIPSVNKDVWGTESLTLTLHRGKNSFGFSVIEACPVRVGRVDRKSPAESAGLQPGDIIVRLNKQNVSRSTSTSVAKLIKHSSNAMVVEVQRPRPVTYEHTEDSPWSTANTHISQAHVELSNDLDIEYDLDNDLGPNRGDLAGERYDLTGQTQSNDTVPQMFTICEDMDDKENKFLPPTPFASVPYAPSSVCRDGDETLYTTLDPNYASLATSTPLPLLARGHRTVQTSEKRKHDAIHDLLTLELDFIDLMHSGMQRYSRPLRHCILSHSQHAALFQNIEKLTTISEYHVKQMHDNAPASFTTSEEDTDTSGSSDNHCFMQSIGLIYQSKVHMLCQAYDLYAKGISNANHVLSDLRRCNDFVRFVQDPPLEGSQPSISSFIYKPVQHVRELYRVIKEVFVNTPSESPDYNSLKQVVEGLQECTTCITNYSCERVESMSSLTSRESKVSMTSAGSKVSFTASMKSRSRSSSASCSSGSSRGQGHSLQTSKCVDMEVMKIQDRLVFSANVPVFQLCQDDRHIVFCGDMFKWDCGSKQWKKIYMILFTDMILQTVKESDGYLRVIQEPTLLREIAAMDAQRQHSAEFVLLSDPKAPGSSLSGKQKLSLRAPSTEQKFAWKSLIEQRVFALRGLMEYFSSTSDVSSGSASAIII